MYMGFRHENESWQEEVPSNGCTAHYGNSARTLVRVSGMSAPFCHRAVLIAGTDGLCQTVQFAVPGQEVQAITAIIWPQ